MRFRSKFRWGSREGRAFARVLTAAVAVWTVSAGAQLTPWPTAECVWHTGRTAGGLEVVVLAPAAGLGDADALATRMSATVTAIPVELTAVAPDAKKPWALPKADVVVVANVREALPAGVTEQLREHLSQGRGLVWIAYDDSAPMEAALVDAFEDISETESLLRGILLGVEDASLPDVQLLAQHKSRIALITHPSPAPLTQSLVPRPGEGTTLYASGYESAIALAVRAIVWASGETPPVRIVGVDGQEPTVIDPDEVPPGFTAEELGLLKDLSGRPQLTSFTLRFDRETPRGFDVTARIRYPELGLARAYTSTVPKGVSSHEVQLPVGYRDFVLDVHLDDAVKTIDWYSRTSRETGWPQFTSVRHAKAVLAPNDTIAVTANVPPHPIAPAAGTVWVRASDPLGRSVALSSAPFSSEGGEVTVRADVRGLLMPMVLVETYGYPEPIQGLATWETPRAAWDIRGVEVDVGFESAFVFAAPVALPEEWGARRHLAALRAQGLQVVLGDEGETKRALLHEVGLFDATAAEGDEPARIDLSETTANEAAFAVWRAMLAGAGGIEVAGIERPGFERLEPAGASWEAVVAAMNVIREGLDVLVDGAELNGRGVALAEADDVFPDGFLAKPSKFAGEWFEYAFGEAVVIVLLADPESERARGSFEWKDGRTAYDAAGIAYSRGRRVTLEPAPGHALRVTLLPYEASRLLVDAPRAVHAGAGLTVDLALKTRDRLPGRHVFRVEFSREYGESVRHYAQTVIAGAGQASVTIPLALNETPGRYEVTARDVLTGLTGIADVVVLEPKL